MVCKLICCSEFLNIPDKAGRKTRRRRTQATAKRFAFYANATNGFQPSIIFAKRFHKSCYDLSLNMLLIHLIMISLSAFIFSKSCFWNFIDLLGRSFEYLCSQPDEVSSALRHIWLLNDLSIFIKVNFNKNIVILMNRKQKKVIPYYLLCIIFHTKLLDHDEDPEEISW